MRPAVLFASLLAAVTVPVAATPAPQPSDQRARDVLGRAARAAGVLDGLPPFLVVEGTGRENLTGELQGLTADEPTWRPHAEWVAIDTRQDRAAWERRTPRNDDSLRHRRFVYEAGRTLIVDHANGFGRAIDGDVPATRRRALMRRVPHLLLADLVSRSASTAEWIAERTVDGVLADEIAFEAPDTGRLRLVVGRDPAVLLSAGYDLHFPGRGDTAVTWHWHGWRRDAELGMVPAGHRLDIDGLVFQDVTYTRYDADERRARALLEPELPSPAARAEPEAWAAAAGPATGEVAPGVHVARLSGFTVMFVEQTDGIVAFEAPEPFFGTESIPASGREAAGTLTPQVIDLIRATIPGKPITHVVISHHHGDHMGGIRAFAEAGAEIVIAARDAAAAREALTRPHTILGDRVPPRPVVRPVDGMLRIGSGANAVEVIDAGANPHTAANLVFWVPAAGVMIQGDLFYFNAGSGFHAGRARMNRFFAEWLDDRGLTPRLIYGVHNSGAAGPAALDAARAVAR